MGGAIRSGGWLSTVVGIASSLALLGCSGGGSDGAPGPAGPAGPPGPPGGPGSGSVVIGPLDPLPGVQVAVVSVTDSTGGTLAVGDFVTLRFTAETDAGVPLDVASIGGGQIYLSGPTNNYQRVLLPQSDVATRSVPEGGGVWAYTFLAPIPALYPAPVNDTTAFGLVDGELQGTPLVDGTYTVGLQMYWYYDVDGVATRDAGSVVKDLLFGSAVTIAHREVVGNANCNTCHTELRAHGGSRVDVQLCVLCHTAGSEDKNVGAVLGGTPGVSVDFRVMIHKIHNGDHLPSVLGIGVDVAGNRTYSALAAPVAPLEYVGFQNGIHDYSEVGFPIFPSLTTSMPKRFGYTAMSANASNKAKEDVFLKGVVACAKCHGDPDAAGPAVAPAQGALYSTQPSRNACGSCHDDIDWTLPYKGASGTVMPANLADGTCATCHQQSGNNLSVIDGHLHPLLDPLVNPGLQFEVVSVTDGTGGAQLDPNDKVKVSFRILDTNGNPVSITSPTVSGQSMTAILAGPTWNYNLVLNTGVPLNHPDLAAGVGMPPVYTLTLPQQVTLERVGLDTGANGEAFVTSRDRHLDLPAVGAVISASPTVVYCRTPVAGGSTTTTAASSLYDNYLDVASTAGLAVNDYVVLGDTTGAEEYVQIQTIVGTRLWLRTQMRFAHPAATGVLEFTLTTMARTTDYTLAAATGTITEVNNQFAGRVVLSTYWADFRVPSFYPAPLNDTPDLGEVSGEWKGKSLVPGTYTLDIYGTIPRVLNRNGETQTYRGSSDAGIADILFGAPPAGTGTVATQYATPYDSISSQNNCYACHDDLWFHGGGRRGFGTCIVCHGDSGGEDRGLPSRPVSASAPGTSIAFREMLHKIHLGKDLYDPLAYKIEGNSTWSSYEHVGFPAMPGGVTQCVKCHGNDAWKLPGDRSHPTQQVVPAAKWGFVCGSCHDAPAAKAHITLQTAPNGVEACDVCHGPGKSEEVQKAHFPR